MHDYFFSVIGGPVRTWLVRITSRVRDALSFKRKASNISTTRSVFHMSARCREGEQQLYFVSLGNFCLVPVVCG